MIRFIDLFAGIGGFRYGLEKASKKYKCVYSNEWDRYAAQIYDKNFSNQIGGEQSREERKHKRNNVYIKSIRQATHSSGGIDTRDITTVPTSEIPDFDLLVGGFPCQAFSIAGKRKGFDDTRGTLFFEIARILADKRPRYFILENVKGLLSHDEGKTFQTILKVLSDLGYDYQWQVLNSKNFGVPQNRERVFVVGHIRGTPRPKIFPVRKNSEPDIVLPTLTARYWGGQANGGYIGNKPQPSVVSSIRRLTPTECERLQGFPDGWTEGISDTQRYKCLGNAVTTNVIEWIGNKLV